MLKPNLKAKKAEALKFLREGKSRTAAANLVGVDLGVVKRLAKAHRIPILSVKQYNRKIICKRCPNGHLINTQDCLQCKIENYKSQLKSSVS